MATIQDIADRLGVSKGTVSKAINNAPDISETLRKTVLDTAVEMGYTRLRRLKNDAKRFCILIENMEYEEPHQFGYDFVIGFRQMAEPAGYVVNVVPVTFQLQKKSPMMFLCSRMIMQALLSWAFLSTIPGWRILKQATLQPFFMTTIFPPIPILPLSELTIMREWLLPCLI